MFHLRWTFAGRQRNGLEPQPCGNADPFDDFVPNEVYRCRGENGWA
jgi:hypothetical protein